jgi:hypothetical protein
MRPYSNGFAVAFDPLAEIRHAKRLRSSPEAFWARVPPGDGCRIWPGRRNASGYGPVSWMGRDVLAHRLAYALAKGPIPAGRVVMHTCDNPPCCNPDHLELGSIDDNIRDMLRKHRHRPGGVSGLANHKSKLSPPLVCELRAAWHAGESIKSIARRTGLAVGTVHPMLHGKTWAHVGQADRAAGGEQ